MATIERRGSITVLRPDRALQRDSLDELTEKMGNAVRAGIPVVVVDLTETPLIDGAGLEWLLDLDEDCCDRGGDVCLCGANELCSDILRITGVGSSMKQFSDLTSALGGFAR
jgi:anti-anti-sigma factor